MTFKKNILAFVLQLIVCSSFFHTLQVYGQDQTESVEPLPGEGNTTAALTHDYFPSRLHTFIWRNWMLVPVTQLAHILQTSDDNVTEIARSMGLPEQPSILKEWKTSRGYITLIRRNWHLLPYPQLLELLGMTRQELAWRLIEDDFLIEKLGTKPYCLPLYYQAPTQEMHKQAKQIAWTIRALGQDVWKGEVSRFSFVHDYQKSPVESESDNHGKQEQRNTDLRIIFSYFTDYGDPLMEPDLSSYPEGLLRKLSDMGVNGIWVHSVLRMLVSPDGAFPGSSDYGQRIDGLRKLVERAGKYGIGIYLYANEPRGMSSSFFESESERASLGGVKEGDRQAFCTSDPKVLDWLERSYENLFHEVPSLAGVFTITASENLTSCVSHGRQADCERCSKHSYASLITAINTAISKGVTKGNPDAKVLVWDWGWKDNEAKEIIEGLPKSCWLMSVSEWSLPIERGGIKSAVGEYSLSSVGPGPRALTHWRYAKEAGLKTVAKVQVNSTWEMAIVPSLPVMDLVARHAENLAKVSTDGVMLSWSLGGAPSDNLKLFGAVNSGNANEMLDSIATASYGKKAAPLVRRAWSSFSKSFEEYPYHISTLYNGPQHMGPSNPLYIRPTGYRATMVGFPYDDLERWCAIYPVDIWCSQMDKVTNGFLQGCKILHEAVKYVPDSLKKQIVSEERRARAVQIHFKSCANQARFTDARNSYLSSSTGEQKKDFLLRMQELAFDEMKNIKNLYPLVKEDPTIGYESSNQYFYLPIDLIEKYVNTSFVLSWIDKELIYWRSRMRQNESGFNKQRQ